MLCPGVFLSDFAEDHPKRTPKWVIKAAEKQRDQLQQWATKIASTARSLRKADAKSDSTLTALGLVADIRSAVGDPTGKLMQDELVAHCRRMSAVVAAARCIRHWHDREPDGMVVSKSHVLALWETLNTLDKPNESSAPAAGTSESTSDHLKS